MDLINYLDFSGIYEAVKKNQLKQYPTAEEYISDLKSQGEPFDYVAEMYKRFDNIPDDAEVPNSETGSFLDYVNIEEEIMSVEWSIGGNNATENGDDYWGYGWVFEINLDYELFVGYREENYS
ncbi:MAG: hypothetical protein V4666_08310 [Bacteroidota bacterium]